MSPIKKILGQLNFIEICRRSGLPLWECPSFIFPLSGLIIILAMITTYFVGTRYVEPEIVALIVAGVTLFLIVADYLVVKGFENLAQANQMKSEFVSIVSHQLRTPLTGIKWTIDLLNGASNDYTSDKDKLGLAVKSIGEQNQRMINLVNDLLNVSRIDQKGLFLQEENLSLKDIIQGLIKEYEPISKANNVALSFKADSDLPLIRGDKQRIRLVVGNLIDNAIKYTKKQGEVEVTLIRTNGFIRCAVKDSGVGIPENEQNKIFQKFFRSKNVLKYQTSGTGLGLFIAKSFAEAFGGKIGFESREGKGSNFWVKIPIKPQKHK